MAQERDFSEQINKRLEKIDVHVQRADRISQTVNDFLPRKRAARYPHGSNEYWDEIIKVGAQDGPVAKVKAAIEQKAKPTLNTQRQKVEEFRDLENRLLRLRNAHESGSLDKSILAEAEAQSAKLRIELGFEKEETPPISPEPEEDKSALIKQLDADIAKIEDRVKSGDKLMQRELDYALNLRSSFTGEPQEAEKLPRIIIDGQLGTANIDGRLIKFYEKSAVFETLILFARSAQKEVSTAQLDELTARNYLASSTAQLVANLRIKIEKDPSTPQILKRIKKNRDGFIYRLDAEVEFVGEQKEAKKDDQKPDGKAQAPESQEPTEKEKSQAGLLQPPGNDFFGGKARRIEYQPKPEDTRTEEETVVLNAILSRVLPISRRDIYWYRLQEHLMINIPQRDKYSASELFEIFANALEKMIEEANDERARLRWSKEDQILGKKVVLELKDTDKRKLRRIVQRRLRNAENAYSQDHP